MPEDKSYDPYVVDEYIFLFKFYIQFKRNKKHPQHPHPQNLFFK